MTKITTDFVGSETIAVTKQRLTDILAYWGASTAAYTTWGQARTALNALLTSTTAGTIGSTELAGSFLPKINFLNDPDDMIADALFGAGEQGVWLDPSDVANVAWRRNLLLYSEQFDNAAWNKIATGTGVAPSVTANAILAPDGSMTAELVTLNRGAGNTGSDSSSISQVLSPTPSAGTYTGSFWVIAASPGDIGKQIAFRHVASAAFLVVTLTSAWQRVSKTEVYATNSFSIFNRGDITADSTVSFHLWGAQLELGTSATDYQRITDLNTEVIERFPNATMYQDAAGTVPVYAPAQPVGLRLDKSKGLVLGSEICTDPGFNNPAAWIVAGATPGWVVSGGKATVASTAAANRWLTNGSILTIGKTYLITADVEVTAGALNLDISASAFPDTTTSGRKQWVLTASLTTFQFIGRSSFIGSVDNISIKELPGNHATQSTLASRPLYGIEPKGGRRNILTYSQDFDNAAWVRSGTLPVVTANAATAPDGTMTADLVLFNRGAGNTLGDLSGLALAPVAEAGTYTGTLYFKAATSGDIGKQIAFRHVAGSSYTVVTLTGDWVRVSRTDVRASNNFDIVNRGTITADNSVSVLLWGAQLETGSTATAYQRVASAFDVTEAGVNSCHYCQYDGSDDGMVTNSIDFTATDKMSVFAGVRKFNSATSIIVENSVNPDATNGVIVLANFISDTYLLRSKGTVFADTFPAGGYVAPVSNVITGVGDISGDRATLRINGTQVAQNTADQGTGSYGNYPLYLGRRGGASLPFNGRDYGILITGKLANATAIATTEMWLANKTPGVNL